MSVEPNIPGLSAQTSAAIVAFCAAHQVRTLRLYGSFVRNELTPESDIDILLEFQPGVDPGLFELGGMQQELTEIFDRDVDLKTADMFSPGNLRRVIESSVLGYAA